MKQYTVILEYTVEAKAPIAAAKQALYDLTVSDTNEFIVKDIETNMKYKVNIGKYESTSEQYS